MCYQDTGPKRRAWWRRRRSRHVENRPTARRLVYPYARQKVRSHGSQDKLMLRTGGSNHLRIITLGSWGTSVTRLLVSAASAVLPSWKAAAGDPSEIILDSWVNFVFTHAADQRAYA